MKEKGTKSRSIYQQLQTHAVAIMSLIIAITALSYETWRNEVTERNRNIRVAAFEILKQLGELQLIVNYAHYQPDNSMGNPLLGWQHVAFISDLAMLLPAPVPEKAENLAKAWGANWESAKTDTKSADKISQEIDTSRDAVVHVLYSLK